MAPPTVLSQVIGGEVRGENSATGHADMATSRGDAPRESPTDRYTDRSGPRFTGSATSFLSVPPSGHPRTSAQLSRTPTGRGWHRGHWRESESHSHAAAEGHTDAAAQRRGGLQNAPQPGPPHRAAYRGPAPRRLPRPRAAPPTAAPHRAAYRGPAPATREALVREAGSARSGFRCGEFETCPAGRYLTEPAVMPATRKRWSSRKPTTIGTLTVSDAAMIWFQ